MQTQHLVCPNGHPLQKGESVCPRCGTIASMNDAIMPSPPSAEKYPTIPGYKITAELGHGGMGVVYKAWQLELQRWVALKMIRRKDLAGPTERTRFQAEARAIARLQHGNIVHVYDVGESESCPYFSLEYVEG